MIRMYLIADLQFSTNVHINRMCSIENDILDTIDLDCVFEDFA
jgi:hypothetical protein